MGSAEVEVQGWVLGPWEEVLKEGVEWRKARFWGYGKGEGAAGSRRVGVEMARLRMGLKVRWRVQLPFNGCCREVGGYVDGEGEGKVVVQQALEQLLERYRLVRISLSPHGVIEEAPEGPRKRDVDRFRKKLHRVGVWVPRMLLQGGRPRLSRHTSAPEVYWEGWRLVGPSIVEAEAGAWDLRFTWQRDVGDLARSIEALTLRWAPSGPVTWRWVILVGEMHQGRLEGTDGVDALARGLSRAFDELVVEVICKARFAAEGRAKLDPGHGRAEHPVEARAHVVRNIAWRRLVEVEDGLEVVRQEEDVARRVAKHAGMVPPIGPKVSGGRGAGHLVVMGAGVPQAG